MGIIHSTISFKDSGLAGIQACQRDWSGYLVHFTAAGKMVELKQYPQNNLSPSDLAEKLHNADKESFGIVKKIQKSMELRASTPSEKDGIMPCICFSECNLPGLVNHCERYGRFGFVFKKDTIFALGGRPTIYVDKNIYTLIAAKFRNSGNDTERKLFSLSNVYTPPGKGEVQDFTHEREWRLFGNINLRETIPDAILCPHEYYDVVSPLFGSITIPLDLLSSWGI